MNYSIIFTEISFYPETSFLIQMAILAWFRFSQKDGKSASKASTAIIVPAFVIFVVFAVRFYCQLVAHKYEQSARGLEKLESMANQLDTKLTVIMYKL